MLLVRAYTSTRHWSVAVIAFPVVVIGQSQVLKKVVEVDGPHAGLVDVAGHAETEGVNRGFLGPKSLFIVKLVCIMQHLNCINSMVVHHVSVFCVVGVEFAFQVFKKPVCLDRESGPNVFVAVFQCILY